MAFNRQAAKQAGYSDQEIDAYLASKTQQPEQPSSWGGKVGGGVGGGILDFFTGGIQKLPGAIQQSVQAQRQTAPQSLEEAINPLHALSSFGSMLKPLVGPSVETAGDLSVMKGGVKLLTKTPQLIKGGVNVAKIAGEAVTHPTKGSVARQTEKIVEKATEKAPKIKWDALKSNITEAVHKKFGEVNEVKNSLKTVLSDKIPSTSDAVKSGTELLDWRRQIGARIGGKNFLQKIMGGSNTDDKVAGEARRIISKELHTIIPETVTPDKVYSIYAKFGDAPAWGKRVIGAYLLQKLFGKQLLGLISGAGD